MKADHHMSASALILKAAEASSLLKEVAEAIWFSSKHGPRNACCTGGTCVPCELLERLTSAFDDHICLAGVTCEIVLDPGREGLDTSSSAG